MSRNKGAVRLAELKGVTYSAALELIRAACAESVGESRHAVAARLIDREEAQLASMPLRGGVPSDLFQEPNVS